MSSVALLVIERPVGVTPEGTSGINRDLSILYQIHSIR